MLMSELRHYADACLINAPRRGPRRHLARGPELEKRMNARSLETEALLTPAEVASMFRVDPKTVTRWAKSGKLNSIRTLGGHRRYREAEVRMLLAGIPAQRQPAPQQDRTGV